MYLLKLPVVLGLAIGSLIFSPVFADETKPETTATEDATSKPSSVADLGLDPADAIRVNVLVGEDILQKTFDELQRNSTDFGEDWDSIENAFVLFSICESSNVNALLYDQDVMVRPLAGDKTQDIVLKDLLFAAEGVKTRAEIIKKVAFNEPLTGFDKKLDFDIVTPLQRELGNVLTGEAKAALAENSRVYMKMKMAYLGLLSTLAKFYKNEQLSALIESEAVRIDEERAKLLNSIYSLSGKDPIKPMELGEKRKSMILEEFIN